MSNNEIPETVIMFLYGTGGMIQHNKLKTPVFFAQPMRVISKHGVDISLRIQYH
ncbi:hypothetical protein [Citrobacter amalonaticus]|uniref:hypothetical protein n=1 Tax=Citrobacter amalonaticus TaxID=35703 RepID=UPI00300D160B